MWKRHVLATTFQDLYTAFFLLLLTLPVTVSAPERSFSKLKLIRNYLRSSMEQMRLKNALSFISIERNRATKLDTSVVLRNIESKARTKNFDM